MAKKPINVKNVSSSGEESTSDMMSSRSSKGRRWIALKENKKKGKEVLNEESPISPMPISYILPPDGYFYVPMNNYQFNFVTSSTKATPLVHQP
ncbi:hypothetical protein H5410_026221 [Solanum commersonii]|uniref:Uncharacterized protein n=1 Tax=Solanum commersonii TaxID=4109 RepID=A0A9J5YVY2_SOLCO|nr:hypothetical protein H5410_026221 [Solanum commersonii]